MHYQLNILLALILAVVFQESKSHAGQRSSVAYLVPAENIGTGGRPATSANYSLISCVGEVTGVSSGAFTSPTAKHGYIAQLADIMGLQLTALTATINETATQQLAGAQVLDDLTTITVPASSITWSIQSGPLSSISMGGLVTAATVYQNTAALAHGSYLNHTGTLGLTVLDTILDNFGAYAADGLGDAWQVQYFGLSNPSAAPLVDPDLDGVLNLVEFATALNPTKTGSLPVATVMNGSMIEFTYLRAVAALSHGLGFIVEWSDTLANDDWHISNVTEQIISDNGIVQQVKASVPADIAIRRFVRLKLTQM